MVTVLCLGREHLHTRACFILHERRLRLGLSPLPLPSRPLPPSPLSPLSYLARVTVSHYPSVVLLTSLSPPPASPRGRHLTVTAVRHPPLSPRLAPPAPQLHPFHRLHTCARHRASPMRQDCSHPLCSQHQLYRNCIVFSIQCASSHPMRFAAPLPETMASVLIPSTYWCPCTFAAPCQKGQGKRCTVHSLGAGRRAPDWSCATARARGAPRPPPGGNGPGGRAAPSLAAAARGVTGGAGRGHPRRPRP